MEWLVDLTVCRYTKNKTFFFVAFSVFLFSCQEKEQKILPFYNNAQFDAEWINPAESRYSSIHTMDTFSLQNQLGNTITKDSLDGFIYVANFFFTSCSTICPKMQNNLQVIQDSLAKNSSVKLVSFSVMPWVDSVSLLKEYGKAHGVHPQQWHLLTGSKERIYELARKSYFAEKGLGLQKTNDEFLHTESMLLVDRKGRLRGIYNATQRVDIGRVLEDINVLLKEERL
ncbi:MAG: SCO family protein [Flavobacteriales bacterium]